jgi:hypothetical protein
MRAFQELVAGEYPVRIATGEDRRIVAGAEFQPAAGWACRRAEPVHNAVDDVTLVVWHAGSPREDGASPGDIIRREAPKSL